MARPSARRQVFAIALLLVSLGATAQVQVSAPRPSPATVAPAFSKPEADHIASTDTLKAFLGKQHKNQRANRFCFVQERMPADAVQPQEQDTIWMVWTTGARIYTYTNLPGGPRDDPASEGAGLVHSNPVNLKTDVVATQDQVGGSTFLVHRAWVDRIIHQCQRAGISVRVAPFKRAAP